MSRSTSRSVRYSRLRLPTVTFTEVGAASRSRAFSMETALPPVRTVTDLSRGVTDPDGCSSPAPPDNSSATGEFWQGRSAGTNHCENQPRDTGGNDRHDAISREFFHEQISG